MRVCIHRGAHEIGGSCVEVAAGDDRIVLDLGMPLMAPGGGRRERFDFRPFRDLPGAELVSRKILPDIPGLYPWDTEAKPPLAVVISHAHQDHYGLASFVRPEVPLYASFGTAALMRVSAMFLPDTTPVAAPVHMKPWQPVQIGPFTVTGHLVDHSAPDALALEVTAGGRKLFYSGDLRGHGRKAKLFDNMILRPPRNVDVLMLEGTMLGQTGPQEFPDETAVEAALADVFWRKTNLALLFCSSQNIDRICSVYRAALRTDSTLVIDLYTAWLLDQLRPLSANLPQYDAPRIRVKYWRSHAKTLADAGHVDFLYRVNSAKIELDAIAAAPARTVFLAKANSLLPRIVKSLPTAVGLELIWSLWPGYLDGSDPVSVLRDEHNLPIQVIHTSGHATAEDLRRLAAAIDAKAVVPMHSFDTHRFGEHISNVTLTSDREWFSA